MLEDIIKTLKLVDADIGQTLNELHNKSVNEKNLIERVSKIKQKYDTYLGRIDEMKQEERLIEKRVNDIKNSITKLREEEIAACTKRGKAILDAKMKDRDLQKIKVEYKAIDDKLKETEILIDEKNLQVKELSVKNINEEYKIEDLKNHKFKVEALLAKQREALAAERKELDEKIAGMQTYAKHIERIEQKNERLQQARIEKSKI